MSTERNVIRIVRIYILLMYKIVRNVPLLMLKFTVRVIAAKNLWFIHCLSWWSSTNFDISLKEIFWDPLFAGFGIFGDGRQPIKLTNWNVARYLEFSGSNLILKLLMMQLTVPLLQKVFCKSNRQPLKVLLKWC